MIRVKNAKHAGKSLGFNIGTIEVDADGFLLCDDEGFLSTLRGLKNFEVGEFDENGILIVNKPVTEVVLPKATTLADELEEITKLADLEDVYSAPDLRSDPGAAAVPVKMAASKRTPAKKN